MLAGVAWLPYVVGAGAVLATVVVVVSRAHGTMGNPLVGLDLRPEYLAGKAVGSGHSVYADPHFVYPPPAALLWAVVAHLMSYHSAEVATAYIQPVLVSAALFGVSSMALENRWSTTVGGLLSILALKGDFAVNSLWLENTSVFLVPAVALLLFCMVKNRWGWAAAVLCVTLVVKPLLAPFAVAFVIVRKWKVLGAALAVAAFSSLATLPLVGTFSQLRHVVRSVAGGSDLVGFAAAVYNYSLRGIGQHQHVNTALIDLVRAAIVALVVIVIVRAWRSKTVHPSRIVAVATALYLGVIMAGSLAEVHYELVALPGLVFVGLTTRSQAARWTLAGAGLLAAFSSYYAHFGGSNDAEQIRAVLFEMTALVGCVIASWGQAEQPAFRDTGPVGSAAHS